MSKPALIILGLLGVLVIGAIAILSFKPADLGPMDRNTVANNPMPIIRDSSIVQNMESSLPVLAASMPEFQGIARWWNTTDDKPLTKEDLKGKVVMVDFWTYSCINCIRTQPFMRKIWDAYKDDGLVIVGVHTPEFAFEKVPANVEAAIKKAGLLYPVALDPNYTTWSAYNNRYWPAGYFFDRQGRLRFVHFGEGEYDKQEDVIRQLLKEGGPLAEEPTDGVQAPNFAMTKTPETYFGYQRMESFSNASELVRDKQTNYKLVEEPKTNEWSLGGPWKIEGEKATALAGWSTMRFNVESNAFHVVMGSTDGKSKRVAINLIGEEIKPGAMGLIEPDMFGEDLRDDEVLTEWVVDVQAKDLYRVLRFPQGGRHIVELKVMDPGVEFYAATFGE